MGVMEEAVSVRFVAECSFIKQATGEGLGYRTC